MPNELIGIPRDLMDAILANLGQQPYVVVAPLFRRVETEARHVNITPPAAPTDDAA